MVSFCFCFFSVEKNTKKTSYVTEIDSFLTVGCTENTVHVCNMYLTRMGLFSSMNELLAFQNVLEG